MIPQPSSGWKDPGSEDYRAFFEAAPAGHFFIDDARRIRCANPAAERLFVQLGGVMQGQPFSGLFAPGSRPAVDEAFETPLTPERPSHVLTVQGQSADGGEFPVEIAIFRSTASDGYGAVVRDLRNGPGSPSGPTDARSPARPEKYTLGELLMANRLRELV